MSNSIQTVDRVLRMLSAFGPDRLEVGVSDFAALLGVHKSTASRLAATLAGRGFLERAPAGRAFRLGPEVGRLGLLCQGGRDLITLAREPMDHLASETGETVNLAVLDGTSVVNVAQADGRHIIGVGNWAGRRTPLHCTSNGKVLLAFTGAALPDGSLQRLTPRTITSAAKLQAQLDKVRRDGWATNVGELEEGLHAVAAPVFDDARRCRAALSVSGPSYRMPAGRLPEVARLCQNAAREIGARLGSDGRPPG